MSWILKCSAASDGPYLVDHGIRGWVWNGSQRHAHRFLSRAEAQELVNRPVRCVSCRVVRLVPRATPPVRKDAATRWTESYEAGDQIRVDNAALLPVWGITIATGYTTSLDLAAGLTRSRALELARERYGADANGRVHLVGRTASVSAKRGAP
jgi:hypothetical protein